jgi:hypothetical protein
MIRCIIGFSGLSCAEVTIAASMPVLKKLLRSGNTSNRELERELEETKTA